MLRIHAQKCGDVTIIRLQGQLVTGDVTCLRNAVLSQLGARIVVLDLARVTRIDARGLGLLLELREQAQSKGSEFRLVNLSRLVQQVFEITRLDSVFQTSTEGEARALTSRERAPAEFEFELVPCD